jgi:hypothetical protein
MRKIFLQMILLTALLGCLKVEYVERPISTENKPFENSYFSISYPQGWIITYDPPFDFYTQTEEYKLVNLGEHEVFVFQDPQCQEYAVWIILEKDFEDSQAQLIPSITKHFKYNLDQERYAKLSANIQPVRFKNRDGFEVVVRGEGFKNIIPEDSLLTKLSKSKRMVRESIRNNAGNPVKEYHVVLLRLDHTLIKLNYIVSSSQSKPVQERIQSVVNSFQIKKGFFLPEENLSRL